MKTNDNAVGKEAIVVNPPSDTSDKSEEVGQTPSAAPALPARPQSAYAFARPIGRTLLITREREARALLNDIAKGDTPADCRAQRRWSHGKYYRRLRLARKLAQEEYDADDSFMSFLLHETRYRRAQREAEARIEKLNKCLDTAIQNGDLRTAAVVHNAIIQTSRFACECEDRILRHATAMRIYPQGGQDRGITVEQMLEDSLDENGNEYGPIVSDMDDEHFAPALPVNTGTSKTPKTQPQ
jgi:hypothetical protein